MTDKTAGTDGDIFADEGVRLNFAICANLRVALDFNKWSDKNVVFQYAVVQVRRFINHHILTARDVADSGLTNIHHLYPLKSAFP